MNPLRYVIMYQIRIMLDEIKTNSDTGNTE